MDVASGNVYPIRPGTLYARDKNDRHMLRVTKGELRLICVLPTNGYLPAELRLLPSPSSKAQL